jgi:hypothetical protein
MHAVIKNTILITEKVMQASMHTSQADEITRRLKSNTKTLSWTKKFLKDLVGSFPRRDVN